MRYLISLTIAASALLAACASQPQPTPPRYVDSWQLAAIGDRPAFGPRFPTLTLDAQGHANGNGGCNSFGGRYEARGNMLTFSRMISTMMACADVNGGDQVMTQEQALLSILNGEARVSVSGDAMAITAIDGRTLHFRRGAAQ